MRRLLGHVLLLWLVAGAASAYVIKLKDGSMLFARMKYEVKGTKAIITLENGTVTQLNVDKIDVPATEDYNKRYSGNVIAIDTPEQKVLNAPGGPPTPPPRLQDVARQSKLRGGIAPAPPAGNGSGNETTSWQPIDPMMQAAFSRTFGDASIGQWKLTTFRGKTRLLVTANNEEAVFSVLSAAARALSDLSDRGKSSSIEIVMTTSTNEPGGTFEMTPDQARQLASGNLAVGDYFVRNVIL
jgi:hypothetical protein